MPWVDLLDRLTDRWATAIEFVDETDQQLAHHIGGREIDRVRYARADRVGRTIRRAAAAVPIAIADAPVCRHGRLELLWYVREQSLCVDYHRYGNLGSRSDELRARVL